MTTSSPTLQDYADVLSAPGAMFWDGYATGRQSAALLARVALASHADGALGAVLFADEEAGKWSFADGLTASVSGSTAHLAGFAGVTLDLTFSGSSATGTLSLPISDQAGNRNGAIPFAVVFTPVVGPPGPPPDTGGRLHPLTPARVLDTRRGTGAAGPVPAGHSITLPLLGTGGIPTTGVAAVALNITVTGPTQGGYLTVWPDDVTRPTTSNLNFTPHQTVPNLVLSRVGADGRLNLYNGSAGTLDILADTAGWFGF